MSNRTYRTSRRAAPTANRAEARANRHLQLVGEGFAGKRGKTLIEKMEDALDVTLRARVEFQHLWDQAPEEEDDPEAHQEAYDNLMKNEGEIHGMLRMLAIMRSTTNKTELRRARIRLQQAANKRKR